MSQKFLFVLTAFCICLLPIFFLKSQNDLVPTTMEVSKELIFLDKNAYKQPVWKDLLELDIIDFQDVDDAFHAYYDNGNHKLSEQQHEAWEKIERAAKSQLDGDGNYYSKDKQYQDLLTYRQATKQKKEVFVQAAFNDPTTYTMQIPNAGNAGQWKNIGPFGDPEVQWSATGNGALQYVEFHPTDPAIMYVCARNRGLWRTTNYGNNWIPLTDHFSTPHTESVEINKSTPDIMYLGGNDKIWRSDDAAHSWTEVFNVGSANRVHEIHSDPNDANRVIASTEGGVYLTTDGGQNWAEKLDGRYVHLDISDDWSLLITADDNSDVSPTLSFSIDKGDTWKIDTITKEYNEVDKFYFAITETNPRKIFAYGILDDNTPTRFIGLWESNLNNAATHDTAYLDFTKITHLTYNYPNGHNNLRIADNEDGFTEDADGYGTINPYSQATWISDFWVNKTTPNQMITLCNKMWGSNDGGILWEYKPSYGGSNWADNRFITTNVANDTIYWCNDGGIWSIATLDMFPTEAMVAASGLSRSNYMRSKVVPKNGDICVIEGSEMDVSQMNKDVIMTGGQDIGQIFTRNGRDAHIASADVYRGRMKPNNDSLFHTGGLYVKIDGSSDTYQVYNNINADYHNPDRMFGFTRKNTTQDFNTTILVRSPTGVDAWPVNSFRGEGRANAGGHGWTPVNNQWETFTTSAGISQIKAGTFEQSRANAEIAFLGDENGGRLFITNDLSASQPTWTQLPNAPSASRYRVATHQFNENIVVAATDAGVYISKDKGQTWAKRGAIPAGSPSRVLMDKNRTEGIYVMTSMTVYYIDESLTDWIEFNQGQPLHQNVDMRIAYYPDGDDRLYVGKYGSGVWASPLYSVLEGNNDMPVVDFRIHGNSKNVIESGETVQLIELSMNYTSLAWTVENGSEVHNVGDEKYPTFALTTSGFYKVTLTATNENGAISGIKEHYIEVLDTPTALACIPTNDGNLEWFERMKKFDINGDNFNVPGAEYYYSNDKIFSIPIGQSATFYGIDNYQTGWNQYWKVWIDYNNDGDFEDDNEAIASSDGQVEEFTRNFTPPMDAVTNTPLRMRVAGVRGNTEPPICNVTSGGRQTVDLFIKIKTNLTITNNHAVQSVNSATITSDYTGGVNVLESGILYSTFDGNLNFNNATKIVKTGTLTAIENFDTPLSSLEYNATYYYQTYVLDESGLNYSEKKNFTLAPYKIPSAESIHANNLGGSEWELKGFAYPEGNNVTSITVEHGENDFANSSLIDISSLNPNNTFNVNNLVDVGAANSYQFRIKIVDNGKILYSNIYTFSPNQTICSPTITNYVWYKRFIGLTLGDFVHDNSNAEAYEDLTATNLGEFEMGKSYTMTMKTRVSSWTNLSYIVYIDLNADNDFEDYNETVGSVGANGQQYNDLTFTIPTEDVIVNKDLTMRIVGHEGGNVNSCSSHVGSYKDITLSIKSGACTGSGHITSFFADTDNDGFGDPENVVLKNCTTTSLVGYASNKLDCDDTNPNINPNVQEICDDGIDNNCDGYTDNVNIAFQKTVSQSSTSSGGVAGRAVDGDTSGIWNNNSVTHTSTEDNPYLDIDLGESHTLDSIIIWNRTDCCSDRLANFYVFLSDTPFSSNAPTTTAGQAGVWSQLTATPPTPKVIFAPTSTGRYLRVQIDGSGILSLAEVHAFTCVQTEQCTFYADADGDGYGNSSQPLTQIGCAGMPAGYVADNTDFDDTERTRYPGAMEICDNMDNDGNGQIDEGANYDAVTMAFDNEAIPTETYTASQTISTDQMVTVGSSTDVHLVAGYSITLRPGFAVAAGAEFHAEIVDDCNGPALNSEIAATARTTSIAQASAIELGLSVAPNPFSEQTSIAFNLPESSKVSLQVFGMNGQIIETVIATSSYKAGINQIPFTPLQRMHGIYYFVLRTDFGVITKKVVVIGK